MIINVFNFGVKMFMVDFEDVSSFIWDNCVQGQINLCDVVCGIISLEQNGKSYKFNDMMVILLVCLCGWYLLEKYV